MAPRWIRGRQNVTGTGAPCMNCCGPRLTQRKTGVLRPVAATSIRWSDSSASRVTPQAWSSPSHLLPPHGVEASISGTLDDHSSPGPRGNPSPPCRSDQLAETSPDHAPLGHSDHQSGDADTRLVDENGQRMKLRANEAIRAPLHTQYPPGSFRLIVKLPFSVT